MSTRTTVQIREAEIEAVKLMNETFHTQHKDLLEFSVNHLVNAIVGYQCVLTEMRQEMKEANNFTVPENEVITLPPVPKRKTT